MNYIITHHDADGSCGGAIIYKKLIEVGARPSEIKIVVDDLTKPLDFSYMEGNDNYVYIVDHPYVPELEGRVHSIVWLDHHSESIKAYDKPDIPGIRSVAMAGCELAWLFAYGSLADQTYVKSRDKFAKQDATVTAIRKKAPNTVYWVGDNDSWTKDTGEPGMAFFIGCNSIPNLSEYDSANYTTGLSSWLALLDATIGDVRTNDMLAYGRSVQKYLAVNNARDLASGMMTGRFKLNHKLKVVALNTNGRGSGTFTSVKDKFDVGLVFRYNSQGRVTANFYELRPDLNVNLGELAKKHSAQGGGHPGAAGCTVDKLEDIFIVNEGE